VAPTVFVPEIQMVPKQQQQEGSLTTTSQGYLRPGITPMYTGPSVYYPQIENMVPGDIIPNDIDTRTINMTPHNTNCCNRKLGIIIAGLIFIILVALSDIIIARKGEGHEQERDSLQRRGYFLRWVPIVGKILSISVLAYILRRIFNLHWVWTLTGVILVEALLYIIQFVSTILFRS